MKTPVKKLARPLLAGLLIALYMTGTNLLFGQVCPLKITVGLPCPGCGMTRAARLLLTGHLGESLSMHPLLIPLLVVCMIWGGVYLYRPALARRLLLPLVAGGAMLLVAVYFWRMKNGFGQPPLDVNRDAFFYSYFLFFMSLPH